MSFSMRGNFLTITASALVLGLSASFCNAQTIYKSERDGVTVYSMSPSGDSKKVDLPELSVVPSSNYTRPQTTGGALPSVPTPVSTLPANGLLPPPPPVLNNPVSNASQAVTEAKRAALQMELANAKTEFAAQDAVRNGDERNYQKKLDRLKPYQDRVDQLQKQLDAMGQ